MGLSRTERSSRDDHGGSLAHPFSCHPHLADPALHMPPTVPTLRPIHRAPGEHSGQHSEQGPLPPRRGGIRDMFLPYAGAFTTVVPALSTCSTAPATSLM